MSNDISNFNNMPLRNTANSQQNKVEKQPANTADSVAKEAAPQVKTEDSHGITKQISQLSEISEHLTTLPDVDSDKVNRIKQAIADGSFKIDPAKVAQSLIDFESSIIDGKRK